MKKLTALVALGVGYVLGTKAGRERYEQIRRTFTRVKDDVSHDPRVQEKVHQAADFARDKAGPAVKDKAHDVAGKIRGEGQHSSATPPPAPAAPVAGDPITTPPGGPQGPLP